VLHVFFQIPNGIGQREGFFGRLLQQMKRQTLRPTLPDPGQTRKPIHKAIEH
jgi:hypothetical protein